MCACCDFVMFEPRRGGGMFMGRLGMLQSLPRLLVSREVPLLSPLFGGAAMSVSGNIVKFSRSLMVFVMRSVVIASRHIKVPQSARISPRLLLPVCKHGPNSRGRVPRASSLSRYPLFHCAQPQCDERAPPVRVPQPLFCVSRACLFNRHEIGQFAKWRNKVE